MCVETWRFHRYLWIVLSLETHSEAVHYISCVANHRIFGSPRFLTYTRHDLVDSFVGSLSKEQSLRRRGVTVSVWTSAARAFQGGYCNCSRLKRDSTSHQPDVATKRQKQSCGSRDPATHRCLGMVRRAAAPHLRWSAFHASVACRGVGHGQVTQNVLRGIFGELVLLIGYHYLARAPWSSVLLL
jgi:hypothetical protein